MAFHAYEKICMDKSQMLLSCELTGNNVRVVCSQPRMI